MTVTAERPINFNDLPDDPFIDEIISQPEVIKVEPGQEVTATLEEARILWNAISARSFSEYALLRPDSKDAVTKRQNFARAFAALELENPNILRGEE